MEDGLVMKREEVNGRVVVTIEDQREDAALLGGIAGAWTVIADALRNDGLDPGRAVIRHDFGSEGMEDVPRMERVVISWGAGRP